MRGYLAGSGETRLGDLELLPPHLQYCDVIQRLAVVGVDRHSHFECLVGETQVSQRDANVAYIIPTYNRIVFVDEYIDKYIIKSDIFILHIDIH